MKKIVFDFLFQHRLSLRKLGLPQQQPPHGFSTRLVPHFVGISAVQGAGKTTLTEGLKTMFEEQGLRCCSFSLDDFYKTGTELTALAQLHPNNPLLQYRGNAGTHDVALLLETLQALQQQPFTNDVVLIPKFDKSKRNGRGDRVDKSEWTRVEAPCDVVLLEGWMLGFQSIPQLDKILQQQQQQQQEMEYNRSRSATIKGVVEANPGLVEINDCLAHYAAVDAFMNTWIILALDNNNNNNNNKTNDFEHFKETVFQWRLEAEQKRQQEQQQQGEGGEKVVALTTEEVRDFVNRFIPAYQLYLSQLYQHGPCCFPQEQQQQQQEDDVMVLKIEINDDRSPGQVWQLNKKSQQQQQKEEEWRPLSSL